MLTITDEAASAIDEILAAREMPDDAGIRLTTGPGFAADGEAPGVQMELAPAPENGDEVLKEEHIFLEPEAALLLDDKLLDAEISAEGTRFMLRKQP